VASRVSPSQSERRSKKRYPVHLHVRYRFLDVDGEPAGEGRTLNMSSTGIEVACRNALDAGRRVEVVADWPTRLEARIPLQLVMVGRVVRSSLHHFSVEFTQHEFRTMRSKPIPRTNVIRASA